MDRTTMLKIDALPNYVQEALKSFAEENSLAKRLQGKDEWPLRDVLETFFGWEGIHGYTVYILAIIESEGKT